MNFNFSLTKYIGALFGNSKSETEKKEKEKPPVQEAAYQKICKTEPGTLQAIFGVKKYKTEEELKENLKEYAQKQTEEFYSHDLREPDEIRDFEEAKGVIELLLKEKPESLSDDEYRRILGKIPDIYLLNTSETIAAFLFSAETFFELKDKSEAGKNYQYENELYFQQAYFTRPNLDRLDDNLRKRTFNINEKDFAFGIKEHNDPISKKELKEILEGSKNLTLDSGSLLKDYYGKDDIYDFPLKFASAVYNTNAIRGSAYIKEEIPELFKEVNQEELVKKLDILSNLLRGNKRFCCQEGVEINFSISNKNFKMKALGNGHEGCVFSITDEKNPPVIMKNYFIDSPFSDANITFAPSGIYGGIGILKEANAANIANVPKLYLANPKITPVYNRKTSKFAGGWAIMQDANQINSKNKKNLKFKDWLNSKGLVLLDDTKNNKINNIYTDTGFVVSKERPDLYQGGWGDSLANFIYANYLNGKTTEDLIELVK